MAKTTSYGIGQYRFNKNYNNYISQIGSFSKGSPDITYYKTSDNYQDILVKLPSVNNTPFVQYGKTFFITMEIPQSRDYNLTLNLKLCAGDPNQKDAVDVTRYQSIKQLVIPAAPLNDSGVISPTLLFQDPRITDKEVVRVQIIDDAHDTTIWDENSTYSYKEGEVYKDNSGYKIYSSSGSIYIENQALYGLEQTWKTRDTTDASLTIKFAFSPKYNLSEGYPYLLIETDRSDSYQRTIQYIENQITYYGTRLKRDSIEINLYSVSNLLERGANGQSQIQSATDSLTHISVWGHPEQILTINGEEIKIGQTGFYELMDFTINNLGVIVEDPNVDRFIIDYEYKIIR